MTKSVMRTGFIRAAVVASVCASGTALAAEDNVLAARVSLFGVETLEKINVVNANFHEYGGVGNVAFPLSDNVRAQIDVVGADADLGSIADLQAYGFNGHLFWQDSLRGRLGVALGVSESKVKAAGASVSQTSTAFGLEGELFHDRWTFGASIGYISIDNSAPDYTVVGASASYYPTDDLRFTGAISYADSSTFDVVKFEAGGEWQFSELPVSVFASANLEDTDSKIANVGDIEYLFFGFRLNFGPDKSLMRRNREDYIGVGSVGIGTQL